MYESPIIICPEREELIQRYNRLYQECELLKSRISSSIISTSLSRNHSNTFSYSSPSSPTLGAMSSSKFSFSQSTHSYPIPETLTPPSEYSLDNQRALMDVNGQIKATLTSLLNCETVKHDSQYRAWVQDRLMDAEHDMRRQRRRKSSADKDFRKNSDLMSLPGLAVSRHSGELMR